jgi:hypothetical protein
MKMDYMKTLISGIQCWVSRFVNGKIRDVEGKIPTDEHIDALIDARIEAIPKAEEAMF